MTCPECHTENPAGGAICTSCATPLDFTLTFSSSHADDSTEVMEYTHGAVLRPGDVLADRYEIQKMLGMGGMGAVYKALDREIQKPVALKVIRPDLAGNAAVLRRFKQELVLARQVTHRNIIRIFDLSDSGATKFITMEYIEGEDLRDQMRREGHMAPERAVPIVAQILNGLSAAHSAGVVHRDLKPQNIRIENGGRAVVMDFGIARSMDEDQGMTRAGSVVGTPDYMSPEQVKGDRVDARSDLFAMGVIVYEMLTGVAPFHGDTMTATLMKRLQEQPRPPQELEARVTPALSAAILKALAVDPAARYADAAAMRLAIENPPPPPRKPLPKTVLAAPAVVALLAVGWWLWPQGPTGPPKPMSLLIADFENKAGDTVFDGTFEPVVALTLEGAPHLTSFDRGQARRVAYAIRPKQTRLDQALARLVAVREGIGVVISGSITRRDSGFALALEATEAVTGKRMAALTNSARDKQALLKTTGQLAAALRGVLGDTTPENARLTAAETVTTTSVEAAHAYALAQELQFAGKIEDSIERYLHALQIDPQLGRAYAGLAVANRNLNRTAEALRQYEQALSHIDRMTEREKFRTRGGYYVTAGNQAKAIEEFGGLVRQFPADSVGHANLALANFFENNFAKALEEGRRGLAIYPGNLTHRNNVAWYALYAGDFATARTEAAAANKSDPQFPKAYLPRALAELAERRMEAAAEVYRQLQGTTSRGASYASLGLGDLAIAQGRLADAVGILEGGVRSDLAANNNDGAALKQMALAEARGDKTAAAKAVELSQRDSVLLGTALLGTDTHARAMMTLLAGRASNEAKLFARLLEGELFRRQGKPAEAIRVLEAARAPVDHWMTRYLLGRAYLDNKSYVEAQAEFDLCIRRRGEAAALFRDDMPTFRYVPPAYYYLAESLAGLKSAGAPQAYQAFLEYKAGDEESLTKTARLRAKP